MDTELLNKILAILTITGWVVGIVSFYYAYRSGKKYEELISKLFNKLASQPFELIGMLGIDAQTTVKHLYDFQEHIHSPYTVTKLDIDQDGEEELLVQSGCGPYSCKLEIYKFNRADDEPTLTLIDSTVVSTMAGYVFNDIDGDGKIEIITEDNSLKAEKPYVMGLRDRVIYRFENKKLKEISRIELYNDEDLKEVIQHFKSYHS